MNVMLAEDEAIIRMDMREMLQAAGHAVVAEARSGEEAVTLARTCHPGCVFMDAHMNGDDGISAARTIWDERLCPVVMVTAYAQADKVREAASAGVFGYVTKPFSEQDLLTALEVAVERFKEELELRGELESLRERMAARKVIDQAKGILMRTGLSEPEAFSRLQKTSMNTRRPLREVAEAVILSNLVE